MSSEDSISAAVQAVSRQIGEAGLNVLINNAAINRPAAPGLLSLTRKTDMMQVYETNVVGPFLLAKVGLSNLSLLLMACKVIDPSSYLLRDDQVNEIKDGRHTAWISKLSSLSSDVPPTPSESSREAHR